MTVSSTPSERRPAALIAVIVGIALIWLSLGDAAHALRPVPLVVGIAAVFAAGWPLFVPAPDIDVDVDDDGRWWQRGAAAAVVLGIGLGIGCARYLLSP